MVWDISFLHPFPRLLSGRIKVDGFSCICRDARGGLQKSIHFLPRCCHHSFKNNFCCGFTTNQDLFLYHFKKSA
uniref:Uncharacterized protein n=1 Tax=Anguilla anguilla TaxID=7936 RepID=A0A0E9PUM7_ANGAN